MKTNKNSHQNITLRTYHSDINFINVPVLSVTSLLETIKSMPNNKDPVQSKLPIEIIKFWIDPLSKTLSLFFS